MRLTRARVSAAKPNYVWRFLSLMLVAAPMPGWAACTTGTTIVCTGVSLGSNVNTSASGVTTTVNSGAIVSGPTLSLGTRPAVNMTGSNVTLNNSGTIDPSLLLGIGLGATGVTLGNTGNAGSVVVNNYAGGDIKGSGIDVLGVVTAVNGVALNLVGNGASTITVNNSGLIEPGLGLLSDRFTSPVIAAYGGAPVNFTNNPTGVINGRVGFGTSATGNRFYNAGTILGSVNMGANSTNQFTAVTGSTVGQGGLAVGVDLGIASLNLNFARLGIIDGGANGNNTLVLQNGANSGATGTGTASADVYKNFSNLTVNSGTWTTAGSTALLTGTTTQTTLNGGLLNVHSNTALGSGQIIANGGALGVAGTGTTAALTNGITLGASGLALTGDNNLTLSGAIVGGGALSKSGAGTLALNGSNGYTGGTVISGGTLSLGTASALGTGVLTVDGNAALTSSAATLANGVALNANLSVNNTGSFAMNGPITGAGGLTKTGGGLLTLAAGNTYGGGTLVNGGGLVVGGNGALGTGLLTIGAASSLSAAADTTLTNNILLSNALTLQGANALALSGAIGGGAALNKTGTGTLTLSGANNYTGGSNLGGGLVNIGNNTALGTGTVTVSAGTTLASLGSYALANNFTLNSALTVGGTGDLALGGALSGPGALIKSGSGTLTLNATNAYGGGTQLNGGRIVAGANGALGTAGVSVLGATTLDTSAAVTLANNVALGSDLTIGGTQGLTLGGVLSGSGKLVKNGSANLTLNGANTHGGGVALNAGTLTLGNAQALGTGLLDVTGASSLALGGLSVSNNVRLGATLGINNGAQNGTLSGTLSGNGGLALNGGTLTLTGNNNYIGGTTLNAGRLVVGSNGAVGSGAITVAGNATLDTLQDTVLSNDIGLNATLTLGGANNLSLGGNLTGGGTLVKNGNGTLTLGGVNTHANTQINAGTLITSAAGLSANVLNNATLTLNQTADATYGGSIGGTGLVNVAAGGSTLVLNGTNTFTGGLNLQSGIIETRGGQALADTVAVNLGSGTQLRIIDDERFGAVTGTGSVDVGAGAAVRLGGTGADSVFGGNLAGAGQLIKEGTGLLTLTGSNGHTGTATVVGGGLKVDGSLASAQVNVGAGAALSGAGNVGGVVNVANGGILSGVQGQTLTLGGLALSETSQFNVALGAPSGSPQTLVQVNGDLTLDGQLNVSDTGGFGVGVYRLIQYTGALNNNGLALGSLPPGTIPSNLQIQTAIGAQVNLLVQDNPSDVLFWNGSTTAPGAIVGGSGTWASGVNNWITANAQQTQTWSGNFAVFSNAAPGGSTVTVNGAQSVTGMQFFDTGYTLAGPGSITLSQADTAIRVDPGATATINTVLTGTGGLNKRDTGTLVLGGVNTYTGGTRISEGVLEVGADTALGTGGGLAFGGGTLRVTGNGYTTTSRAIDVGAGAGFDIASAANTFTLNQALTGAGRVTKLGAGTLVLGGNNTTIGGVNLNQGTLLAGQAGALGGGSLEVGGNATLGTTSNITLGNAVNIAAGNTLTLGGASDYTLAGNIAGAGGTLNKIGGNTVTLNGANTYAGGTTLAAGAIRVGHNTALGTGALNVTGSGSLLADSAITLGNGIVLGTGNALSVGGAGDLTLNGNLSGAGALVKTSGGTLTLNGTNTHGRTQLDAGTLVLGSAAALGSGSLDVTGPATLDSSQAITLGNAIDLQGGVLTVASNQNTTLTGTVQGAGGLVLGGANTTLTLTGVNTYQGDTVLDGGNLRLGASTALGSTGDLIVRGPATLGGTATGSALVLGNGVQLDDNLSVTGDQNVTLNGTVDGAGTLIKSGTAGTLTLNGANTHNATELQGGTLAVGNDTALGAGTLTVSGSGTLAANGARSLGNAIVLDSALALNTADGLTLSGDISGAGSLRKGADGLLELNGNNSYQGGTTLEGGILRVGSDTALGDGEVIVAGATELGLSGGVTAATLQNTFSLSNTLSVLSQSGQTVTLAQALSGAGGVTKTGTGTLVLAGNSDYAGGTTLNAGTLIVGGDSALGTGDLRVTGAARLEGTQAVTLANDVTLSDSLTVAGPQDLTLAGDIGGTGTLVKNDNATLTLNGANDYSGGTLLNAGTLVVGNDLALGSGTLTAATTTLSANRDTTLSNDVTVNGALTIAGTSALTLGGDIDGAGGILKNDTGTLTLTGANTYTGGTTVNAGTLVGNTGSLQGAITAAAGSSVNFNQTANGTYAGAFTGGGNLVKQGGGELTLSGTNAFGGTGTVDVQAGTLVASGGSALTGAAGVAIGNNAQLRLDNSEAIGQLSGAGTLNINGAGTALTLGSAASSTFDGVISGDGALNKTGSGVLTLAGANTLTGTTTVQEGRLNLTGQLDSGTVQVNNDATLSGSGQASGNVIVNSGGTLEIATATAGLSLGELTTANGSTINAYLGAAGNDALVHVAGDANLSGSLNVYDAGGFGVGVYRLFTSGGAIVNNLTLVDRPGGSNLSFLALTGQLNLLNQTVQHEVQFWDGANGSAGIDGGSGTWSAGGNNWVNADDNANNQWGGRYAVFDGVDPSGTALVTVQGTQNITGMQFGTDGYRLVADGGTGGALQTSAATGNTTIRVEPGVTATLAVPLTGDGTIAKTDSGTLVFETANSYTGGTRFEGGVVRITADDQLGAAGTTQALGGLTFAGGTLEYAGTADATTGRLVTLEGAGTIAVADGNAQYTITQGVTGPGELTKSGAGTLVLAADGTYQGGTQLQGGTLLLGSAGALGDGALTAAGGTALGTTAGAPSLALANGITLNGDLSLINGNDLRLDGDVTGAGGLIKSGAGDLTLAGNNDYSGNTQLQNGTLNVASNNALGTGILIATGGTSLDALTGVTLQNNVQLGAGQLTVPGTADLTLTGDISGAGGLTKEGGATLTLAGANSYGGGTTLSAGTLLVGNNAALGTGGLDAAAGTTLAASASGVALGNAISLDGLVAIGNANDLTLTGDIDGAGGITKTGTGTLTLAGDNGYSGGTDLTAGTLRVGSDTALGTGDLTARNGTALSASTAVSLANNVLLDGSVTVNGNDNLTLTGLVADAAGSTGTLVKSGNSVLTLAGANTYSGGTTLSAGSIVVGNSAALGTGDLTVAGNGTLSSSGPGVALANDIDLQAALTVNGTQPLTLAGDINGAGSLVKDGAGTLTLTGSNGYTGGTTLNGGALVGNTDSLVGAIGTAASTTVTFSQPGAGTYAGAISGGGAVVIAGGDITFTGANNYTGGTTVSSGTLTGNAGSLTGNIVDNGTVIFDQDGIDGTYTGNVTGSGSLIKTGDATLVMTGNSNVAGGTTISQGTLQLDGTLTGGPVQVNNGAQLGGSGTVTSNVALANGARLVAGTPINPISFGGDLSLSNGTELDFTLGTPNSATTAVTVAGALTLDGVLNVTNGGGLGTGVYRLFSAQGGITDNGVVYGTLPVEMATGNVDLQVSSTQANLVYQAQAGDLLFWNGAKTVPDGVIGGGSGTWNAGNTNWTDSTGSTADPWNGRYAVFSTTGGTVTIEGTQAVTGLQFLDADYTLVAGAGGEINLTEASTPVRVDAGTTATISAPIVGTGGLNKADGGTLVLAGTNTYAGGTTISAGKISVSADDQLGLASSGITLNGGTLSISDPGYLSTGRNIVLGTNGGGIEVVAAAQVFTIGQPINGDGGLIKQGDGTLVLTGANGYTGGTQVAGGTLAGDSISLQGAIGTASGTTLRFDQATDGTFNGSIGGAGQLVKEGTGTLTLTQPSSYTGGTSVNAGTLVGDTSSLQGTIANNSVLVFNQGADGNFTGTLAGSGQLTKEGGGTLGITGTHGFNGILDVNAGTVALGTEAAPATLPAAVQVNPGGTLAGYGTVASLNNTGTVSTGAAAGGGLRVSGDYTGASGSTLVVNLRNPSDSGLWVSGNATLGGTLRVVNSQPLTGNDTYTVVRADQGLTGTFATTELPNLAFVDAAVAYGGNDVQVNFTRNNTGFEEVAQTPNQEAVAGALNGLPAGSALYASILGLSADEAADAFKQLSGDSHASLSSALMRGSETIRTTSLNHLRNSIQLSRDRLHGTGQSSGEGPAQTCQEQIRQSGSGAEQGTCKYTLWADVQGSWQRQDGDGNAPSYRQRIGGVTVGGDVEVGDGWRVGAAVGYQDSTIWQDSRNARSKSDSYSVSIYGGKSFLQSSGSALNVMAGAAYAWHDINSKRDLTLAGQNQELEADYRGNTTQIFGELGYEIPVAPQASVEPFVGAAWMKQRMGSFSEDGGTAALSGSRQSNDITTTTVGLRGRMDTEIAGAPARLSATLGWRHAMGDVDPERTMAFATGPSFTVAGTPISRNALVTEIGAEVAVSRNAAIGLSYQGQFGSGARENAGFLNVRWNF